MSGVIPALFLRTPPARARVARRPAAWLYDNARREAAPLARVLRGLFLAALLVLCVVCYAATVVAVLALLVRAISECSAKDA